MKKSIPTVCMIALIIFFSACTARWADLDTKPVSDTKWIDGETLFGYKKAPIEARESLVESTPDYDLVRVSFPSYNQDDPVNRVSAALYFRQKTPGSHPSLVVIPILGGDYDITLMLGRFFARRGYNILHFERKSGLFERPETGLKKAREVMIESIIDQRRGIDWWLTKPEVDAKRLGVLGVSMGGFQASLLMAVDRRLQAGAFVLNGCDIPELLFVSKEPSVIEYIQELEKKSGFKGEALRAEAVKQMTDIDPKVFAPNLAGRKVLTVQARFDQVVPFTLATRWYEAAGRPNRVVVPTGHYSAIFVLHHLLRSCLDHFEESFDL